MDKQIRGCIYARYSRLLSGQSLENQLLPLRALALQRGFIIVEEYTDEGISGARERRPGLDRMVRDAYLGRFQLILIAALDRLGRDGNCEIYSRTSYKCGITVENANTPGAQGTAG